MSAVAQPFVHPPNNVTRHACKKIVACSLISVYITLQQLRVVIAHLLEVRHDPALIDRIAMEAARQLVISTAARHLLQSADKNGAQVFITRASARILLHHQIERRRMRELRSVSKSAIDGVKHLPRRFQNPSHYRAGNLPFARRGRFCPRDRALYHLRLLHHIAMLLAVSRRNRKQNALKTWPPVSV